MNLQKKNKTKNVKFKESFLLPPPCRLGKGALNSPINVTRVSPYLWLL